MAPFWRKRLVALGGVQARAAANRSVRVADLMFTLPGWVVVLATGIMLIIYRGMHGGWLHLSLLLFLGWLVLWHVLVLRARKAMIAQPKKPPVAGRRRQSWHSTNASGSSGPMSRLGLLSSS